MRARPVFLSHISYPVEIFSDLRSTVKTDIGVRVYIANIFTFTTLIDRFTSFVCPMHTGYKVTNL